ncbi:hypothetical protein SAMN05192566_1315 [Methylophilus rhizosphaerae]|uniref:Anti-sigma-F factor NrsF n=1 Tax=Methylophilus rhizosphaerae TaxID=492660 RepID=A0A1G9BS47_9PROT|nr:DUF1109 domain-containing protein [Methylophilus rhizosphaerae]SDK42257.1 hypothetical protein SAMN05192566_1315 [Methylophilus rhizosphaerae]
MKTDELIKMLSTNVEPVPPYAAEKLLGRALAIGAAISLILLLAIYGLRPDLKEVSGTFAFWMKMGVPLANAALGLLFIMTLARPGKPLKMGYGVLVIPIAVLWIWAIVTWLTSDPALHAELLWGNTWRVCIMNIAFLALPVGAATFMALQNLAPTKPVLTGAIAGWLAGGVGASVYALHCPEMAAPFLAVWYVLGMLVPSAVMAYLGHRSLRW